MASNPAHSHDPDDEDLFEAPKLPGSNSSGSDMKTNDYSDLFKGEKKKPVAPPKVPSKPTGPVAPPALPKGGPIPEEMQALVEKFGGIDKVQEMLMALPPFGPVEGQDNVLGFLTALMKDKPPALGDEDADDDADVDSDDLPELEADADLVDDPFAAPGDDPADWVEDDSDSEGEAIPPPSAPAKTPFTFPQELYQSGKDDSEGGYSGKELAAMLKKIGGDAEMKKVLKDLGPKHAHALAKAMETIAIAANEDDTDDEAEPAPGVDAVKFVQQKIKEKLDEFDDELDDDDDLDDAEFIANQADKENADLAAAMEASKAAMKEEGGADPVEFPPEDDDPEMAHYLALIAAQENAEKEGRAFDLEAEEKKMTDSFKIEDSVTQLPDGTVYIGQGYRKGDTFVPNGNGTLMEYADAGERELYIGEFLHGLKDGHGVEFNHYDGFRVEGQFHKGYPHGECKAFAIGKDEPYFTGTYNQGEPRGKGRLVYHGGVVFVGDQHNMRFSGDGEIYKPGAGGLTLQYRGQMLQNRMHGHGTFYDNDNLGWEGQFDNGTMTGEYEMTDGFRIVVARFEGGVKTEVLREDEIELTPDQRREMNDQLIDVFASGDITIPI